MNYTPNKRCRACDSTELPVVFSLGYQPLANDFYRPDEWRLVKFAPLDVQRCSRCSLAQLSVVVNPKHLYSKYAYHTSRSSTMVQHLTKLWSDICSKTDRHNPSVIEIGSNDGFFLNMIARTGSRVLGIDPAKNLAQDALREFGITTICDFFTSDLVTEVRSEFVPDIVIMRHVFAHLSDWDDTIAGLAGICGPDTLIAIEVPDIRQLLHHNAFDTIYHEHLSYVSAHCFAVLLERMNLGLRLVDVLDYSVHGGSMVLLAAMKHSRIKPSDKLAERCQLDRDECTSDAWSMLGTKRDRIVSELQIIAQDYEMCLYGASAKATVIVNACRFSNIDIPFATDTTPEKQGCTIPGTGIQVLQPSALLEKRPKLALLGAWNYAEEIVSREVDYQQQGGRFVRPIPSVEIMEPKDLCTR